MADASYYMKIILFSAHIYNMEAKSSTQREHLFYNYLRIENVRV